MSYRGGERDPSDALASDGDLDLTCETVGPLLVELRDGTLGATAEERLTIHLASCEACAARYDEQLAAVFQLVRSAPTIAPPAAIRAQFYARITAGVHRSTGRGGEFVLDDEQEQGSPISLGAPSTSTTFGGQPPRRWTLWASTVAAVAVVGLLAAVFVAMPRGRAGLTTTAAATGTASPEATLAPTATSVPCAVDRLKATIPANGSIQSVSMVSATDGWAVGSVRNPQAPKVPKTLVLHFSDCQWAPVADSISGAELYSVSMGSADDGWAVGATLDSATSGIGTANDGSYDNLLLLHYTSGHWQRVDIPGNPTAVNAKVHMASRDAGWMWVDNGLSQIDPRTSAHRIMLLRYQHGTWTQLPMPPVPVLPQPPQTWGVTFRDLWGTADALWIVGDEVKADGSGKAVICAFKNGVWTVVPDVPQQAKSLTQVSGTSDHDIWATGDAALHFDGTSWMQLQTPTPQGPDGYPLYEGTLAAGAPNELWGIVSGSPFPITTDSWLLHATAGQTAVQATKGEPIGNVVGLTLDATGRGWAIAFTKMPPALGGETPGFVWMGVGLIYFDNGHWHRVGG